MLRDRESGSLRATLDRQAMQRSARADPQRTLC
jgi:hypothetical protein